MMNIALELSKIVGKANIIDSREGVRPFSVDKSYLQGGMHHLEARFMFDKLKSDLEQQGVAVMTPFSYFDFLKQAFTQGDTWKVDKTRLDRLIARGSINKEQYGKFLKEGAIGSHMENLERDQGFKGFNKASVTKIISETDPRKQYASGA